VANPLAGRAFIPLFLTQALGALNDNMFKNALVVLALYHLSPHAGAMLVAVSGGLFLLPYALVSAPAGQMADAHEKSRLILWVKLWELGLMLLAAGGFLLASFPLLLAVLFGLGLQAAFFSPLKYGILPDTLSGEALVAGNGLIEAGTFIGIILGTLAGGVLVLLPHGAAAASLAGIAVALAGIAAAWFIPRTAVAAPGLRPGWNLWREAAALLRLAAVDRSVYFACLAISWFWALGATVLAAFPTLARNVLHADGHVVTLMLGVFALGVGIGSLAVARFVHDARLLRYTVIAGAGISLFTADFALTALRMGSEADIPAVLAQISGWHLLADLFALAICGGMFSVPFYVLLQERAAPSHRARMVGANNILNALATAAAAGLAALGYARGLGAPAVLLITAAANAAVTVWVWRGISRV
jgi:prepilin-type processing-associated H-X9-DG protein